MVALTTPTVDMSGQPPDGAAEPELPVKSAADILATALAADLDQKWIDVPEWGTRLRLREVTQAERLHAAKVSTGKRGIVDESLLNEHLFLMSVVEPRFTREQYRLLCNRSSRPFARVMEAIKELIGLGDDDGEDAGARAVAAAEARFQAAPER